jgi:hypothetical protein
MIESQCERHQSSRSFHFNCPACWSIAVASVCEERNCNGPSNMMQSCLCQVCIMATCTLSMNSELEEICGCRPSIRNWGKLAPYSGKLWATRGQHGLTLVTHQVGIDLQLVRWLAEYQAPSKHIIINIIPFCSMCQCRQRGWEISRHIFCPSCFSTLNAAACT